ncbi:ABC transporter permease [Sphaerobacter thermophilus]|uniref:Inner-membrane translocator n=1 Tax=Sphaerobacter thermophilus (strain ATCC 49802 / DSM 20745 / KCCM 41009 / NCIMB 13125 / S 6022) TaxID=479434 RepID=D1C8K8_SPHTD|nr:ABC transporter permease [Sphaerobacter thermophilus]ACZ40151.1 inner-membrane translocator [Sphaerobacter thermophilus DSM 20745]
MIGRTGVATDSTSSARREWARENLSRLAVEAFGLFAFYLAVVLFFSIRAEQFLSYSNAINILSNVSVIGIVSIGQALTLISGGFDLSVSGTVPLGAVSYALLTNSGVSIPLAILLVLGIGMAVGLVNGLLITKVGINPLIATLGTLSITGGLARTVTKGLTKSFEYPEAGFLADSTIGRIPNHVWALLGLALLSSLMLRYTVFGRSIYAIGGNREASRLAGLRVDALTVSVYMICGMLAAFAGIVVASQLLAGSATLGANSALTSIAAVVLGGASLAGGRGGIPGTLVGVLILGTLANGLALLAVPAFYQEIATGVVLLLAVGMGRLRALFGAEE